MKTKLLLVLAVIFFILSCKKDQDTYIKPLKVISACGYDDPLNQLEWLNELAYKSLHDKTGNYIGRIWVITYENSDIIVTDMNLGSGGILLYLFDCNGKQISTRVDKIFDLLTDSNMIYSSANLQGSFNL